MTRREFIRFAEAHLLPRLPDFQLKGAILYRPPLEYLLLAVTATPAIDRQTFYLSAVVQPLFVPYDGLTGSVYRSPRWKKNRDTPDMIAADLLKRGVPRLRAVNDIDDYRRLLVHEPPDVGTLEPLAYALLLIGDEPKARHALDEAIQLAQRSLEDDAALFDDDHPAPEREMLERLQAIADHLNDGGLGRARGVLHSWRAATLHTLALRDLPG